VNGPTVHPASYFRGRLRPGGKRAAFMGRGRVPASSTAPTSPAPRRTPLVASGVGLFNNLNAAGMTADGETPPDSTGAIGPSNYVEMDNSNFAVYDRSLHLVSTISLDAFTGNPSGVLFCDPQVQWDPAAQRFLFSFLYCNPADTLNQAFFYGWTKTADPADLVNGWCGFGAGTPNLLLDYDKLGHSSKFLVIGGNLYDVGISITNPPFVSAGIAWFNMPANGDQSCTPPASHANGPAQKNGDGTTPTYTPVPVNTTSNASDVWIISSYDTAGNTGIAPTAQSKISTWDLDSSGTLHPRSDISVSTFNTPTPAAQAGSGLLIDTLDGRLTQAVGDPSVGIYTQHTVLDSSLLRSDVDWYQLKQVGSNLTLVQQGTIDTANEWTYNAAIAPRSDSQGAAIFYNVSNGTNDPSIVAQVRVASTPIDTFEPGRRTLATSSAADVEIATCGGIPCGSPRRWGDYSGASPDPANPGVVWGTNMINTAATTAPAWADQNFAVVVGAPPHAPAVTAAADGRGDAFVTWTPSTVDPGTPLTGFTIVVYQGVSVVKAVNISGGSALAGEVTGLTTGQTYTFTVVANDIAGPSPESAHTNAVVVGGVSQISPPPTPSSRGVNPGPTPSPQPR
jgi:hypothetical protein